MLATIVIPGLLIALAGPASVAPTGTAVASSCENPDPSGLCPRPGNSTYPGPAYEMTQQQYGIGPGAIIGPFGVGPMPPTLITN